MFDEGTFFYYIFNLAGGIIETGQYLFRNLFYSLRDWLNEFPENGLLDWLDNIAILIGLDWLVELSFVELIFSPVGIWTVLTILLVYFMIP